MKKLALILLAMLVAPAELLALGDGSPKPMQMYFQEAASVNMEEIIGFHDWLMWIIGGIFVLVMGAMFYAMIRFRASKNPVPSKTVHNGMLELIWFVVPVIIVVIIAIPSMKLTYFLDKIPEGEEHIEIKVIGHQFYWEYQYGDSDVTFESYLIEEADLKEGQLRLLEVDNRVIVPVGMNVRLLITSAPQGVIHAWAVPSLGVKSDAVPGAINESWFRIEQEGVYRGQCSELCGPGHGFMPIVVEAVSPLKYHHWLSRKREEAGLKPLDNTILAEGN